MARKGFKKRNKVAGKVATLRTRVVTGSWFAVVLLILYFIVRYVATSGAAKAENRQAVVDTEALMAVKLPDDVPNTLCRYKGFIAYFNRECHIPNVVIYELTNSEAQGTLPRYKNFLTDENVEGCANPWDYSYSGYDRGHMAPAGDMKWDQEAMKQSFFMTNICPQAKALNTGAWNKLESRVRQWAQRDSALIVATGPVMKSDMPVIGDSKVAVPPQFFKVVLAHHATPMRAIAFVYDNARSSGGIEQHAVSVDSVERLTGIDFFASIPDDVEGAIESSCDMKQWDQRK